MKRKIREQRSKVYGTKQVIKTLNQAAHATVHDLDTGLASGTSGGYCLFWSTNTFMVSGDISQQIYAPAAGNITAVYASLPIEAVAPFTVTVYVNAVEVTGSQVTVDTGDLVSADVVPELPVVEERDVVEVEIVDAGGNYGRGMVFIVIE